MKRLAVSALLLLLTACSSSGQPTGASTPSPSVSAPEASPTMLTAAATAYLQHLTALNGVIADEQAAATAEPGVLADKKLAYAKLAGAYEAFVMFVRSTTWPADVQSAAREVVQTFSADEAALRAGATATSLVALKRTQTAHNFDLSAPAGARMRQVLGLPPAS